MAQIRVCVRIFPFCLFLTQTNTDENNHEPELIDNMKIKDKNSKCITSNRKHFVMQLQFPSMEGVAAGELG